MKIAIIFWVEVLLFAFIYWCGYSTGFHAPHFGFPSHASCIVPLDQKLPCLPNDPEYEASY